MPDSPDAQKKETSQSSENIEIPPIPKQTAGAVAGAAVGSIAGPIGAVVGGGWVPLREKRPRSNARLLQEQGGPSARSLRAQRQPRNNPLSGDRSGSLSLDRAKLARPPVARLKRVYRVDQRQQDHAKLRGLGEDRHRRRLFGNALAVEENGVRLGCSSPTTL
jgi:hypothetical protein